MSQSTRGLAAGAWCRKTQGPGSLKLRQAQHGKHTGSVQAFPAITPPPTHRGLAQDSQELDLRYG